MKNKKQLTREQRYEIEVLLRAGKKQKEIAELVGKDKSVISRELKRNSHKRGPAQKYADERRERYRFNRKLILESARLLPHDPNPTWPVNKRNYLVKRSMRQRHIANGGLRTFSSYRGSTV
ncbi:MAG: helix-turn-helix domain-containing protein [Tannerella sp.]|jgi:transposase|nr:helix-turn-helix domain-containing protein [Tannerella sp.]